MAEGIAAVPVPDAVDGAQAYAHVAKAARAGEELTSAICAAAAALQGRDESACVDEALGVRLVTAAAAVHPDVDDVLIECLGRRQAALRIPNGVCSAVGEGLLRAAAATIIEGLREWIDALPSRVDVERSLIPASHSAFETTETGLLPLDSQKLDAGFSATRAENERPRWWIVRECDDGDSGAVCIIHVPT